MSDSKVEQLDGAMNEGASGSSFEIVKEILGKHSSALQVKLEIPPSPPTNAVIATKLHRGKFVVKVKGTGDEFTLVIGQHDRMKRRGVFQTARRDPQRR